MKPGDNATALIEGKTLRVVLSHPSPTAGFWVVTDINSGRVLTTHDSTITLVSIPHIYRRTQFDVYAADIGRALRAWPHPIDVLVGNRSVETVSCRLRDAIRAKERYGYTHPSIDEEAFVSHPLSVAKGEGKVIVGPRKRDRLTPHNLVTVDASLGPIDHIITHATAGSYTPPQTFCFSGLDDERAALLESRLQVKLEKNETGHLLCL